MKSMIKKILLLLILVGPILTCCTKKTKYAKVVEKELASGERFDSLFLGTYFGMPSQDFYDHCWKLNKEGLIREGASNRTVFYTLPDFPKKAALEFYPLFKDGKVQSMTGHIHCTGWAPWNKDLWAENVIEDVKNYLEGWYGPGFFPIKSPTGGRAYIKVDGNRRIMIYYDRDERVELLFSDLTNEDSVFKLANS